jgi:hypothetical protein
MTREAIWYCRLLDGYALRQSMHPAGARPERRHPGYHRDASGQDL